MPDQIIMGMYRVNTYTEHFHKYTILYIAVDRKYTNEFAIKILQRFRIKKQTNKQLYTCKWKQIYPESHLVKALQGEKQFWPDDRD